MQLIALPSLSEADPEVAGEGSIDPLGLATLADRLADQLVPDVTARMQRIRFVTAIAVGAIVTDDMPDEPPADGTSTPQICFEWHVLEAFVRKAGESGALKATGVPGSAKAAAVLSQGQRLCAANYLKGAPVFGFNGVYQPLARGLRVTDANRLPGERAALLVEAWEQDQDLSGFTNASPGSSGASLRGWLRDAVLSALRQGRCTASPSAHLWIKIARSLAPMSAGPKERILLRKWLLEEDRPIRRELALALDDRPTQQNEATLLEAVLPGASQDLRERIEAITAYERFSVRLDAAFSTLRYVSTHQGSQPLTRAGIHENAVLVEVARELPAAFAAMTTALEPLGLVVEATANLGAFADQAAPDQLLDRLLEHHRKIQRAKGKREWFEDYGPGVVVRPQYRREEPADIDDQAYVHPFRVAPLRQFLDDLRP